MYQEFFRLSEKPFALLPDPRFLFLSRSHREALAHLMYGIEQGEGFIEVTGQVGTGKTTLCRTLLDRIGGDAEIAYIFNPSRSEIELLTSINREFGLPTAVRSRSELIDELNRFLIANKAEGRRVLLVIDEAQNLDADVLEQIRLLSNLETEREKLLQIVLIGQPELEANLARTELRQLRQRITVRWSLHPFGREETGEYVEHRLRVAGRDDPELFTDGAIRALYRHSKGVPRLINALADRALLAAYSGNVRRVDAACVRRAVRELPASEKATLRSAFGVRTATATSLLAMGVAAGFLATAWWPLEAGSSRWAAGSVPAALMEEAPAEDTSAAIAYAAPAGLLETDRKTSAAVALRLLLERWGYPAPSQVSVDPNVFSAAVREVSALRVFTTRSSLDQLRGLDLPVILELEPAPDQRRYVAVLALDEGGGATVGLLDRDLELDRAALERLWTGRAFFVWDNFERLPALAPGMSGSAVRWLQARLTQLGYLRPGDPSGLYDAPTLEAVRRFQQERAVRVDGEVGPATLIALYQALGYGAPRLVTPGGVS